MSETKDTEIRSKYDDFTVEELTEELKNVFFCSCPITGKEVSEMEQLLDILRQRDPLPGDSESEDLWGRFLEVHGDEVAKLGIRNTEEVVQKESEATSATVVPVAVPVKATVEPSPAPKRGFRKLLHTALIAAAVVAAMIIVTASASAAGINIWGWVMVRGEGTVQYMSEETAKTKDISSALMQLGIEEPLLPTWIPEGFVLHELQMHLDKPIVVCASYLYRDRSLILSIRETSEQTAAVIIESDDNKPLEYEKDGTIYCIYSNFDTLTCSWLLNEYLITYSGDISVEEMKRMINSISEVLA